ncbi:hypothetical protein [Rhizohabitans arisaemae]|uniref:hypothetical protein n=1 Tax=Rhizohabitans arisaemae TaxID=2720610 RepID=UPI0024B1509E|nr:hypothetical protein [Rhizohabitans arisaemae]
MGNRNIKRRGGAFAAILLSVTAFTALTPGTAQATPAECDGTAVVGRFRAVESGASFNFNGRRVELQNESLLDRYSRAEIKTGFRSGDQVWIDRSRRTMSQRSPRYFSDDNRVRSYGGGWKQCGPFNVFRTQSVYSWHYAVRACARIDNVSRCGNWAIDQ